MIESSNLSKWREFSKIGFVSNDFELLYITFKNTKTAQKRVYWIPASVYKKVRVQCRFSRTLADYERIGSQKFPEERGLILEFKERDRAEYIQKVINTHFIMQQQQEFKIMFRF